MLALGRIGRSRALGFVDGLLQQTRSASCVATALNDLTEELPMKDTVRFTKHNRLWTRAELKLQSEALATGWYDLGCRTGDAVAIWLPDYAEKIACQLAAAIGGYKIVIVDPALDRVEHFDKVLFETGARIAVVTEKHNESLKKAIPEMEFYAANHDFSGRHFRSRRFTKLRFCSHTGFDLESGFLQFRNMLVYHMDISPIPQLQAAITDDSPLSVTYSEKNGEAVAGPTVSHKDVLAKESSWAVVASILNKEYVEV
eukprot:TRINITY_DN3087_c0_g1_i1.p1 TRINITY_DN3087_c0_g1~~TRINITY_DN3087_c0_g1_i1.p1  ORF type:complete len:257 (+),score=54.02 TRINITY_DN3087_c0_g1_i1:68-838(+)